ncbi:minor capsid protein [Sporolactobacillus terrae]|uniref:minor capsid protein n=1 Tax=Sporolactobacillus terrae TaxID=269673 RepID=UPI001CBBCFFC|nr:minor capsid protein [Sporolactobacillus terrae]UAK17556.1 minor capsid protein [Sporolactobacillus terrae]
MIQSFLMHEIKPLITGLTWTIDNYSAADNTGTVYSESGGAPDLYDPNFHQPEYMVFIRSSDWAFAEYAARQVFDHLHKMQDRQITISKTIKGQTITNNYYLYLLQALSEPLRVGVDDAGLMQWSINFRATLREA